MGSFYSSMGPLLSSGALFPLSDDLPEGFAYQPEFLSGEEESRLLGHIRNLTFQEFDFHGYTAKRRVVEYGLEYDFGTRKATATQPFPEFLLPIRERAARFAGLQPEALVEGIVTEYSPGAPIGWHRDAPQFGTIVGISLAGSARMRLKPYVARNQKLPGKTKPISLILDPRSIYVMRGPARWRFRHSIPPVAELRYSITFRTLRGKEGSVEAA
jgi:alkylated DNA repair dioxygenase AlkB